MESFKNTAFKLNGELREDSFEADKSQRKTWYTYLKRLLDIVLSLALLFILAPVFLIVAFAVKLDSKGRCSTGRTGWAKTEDSLRCINSAACVRTRITGCTR